MTTTSTPGANTSLQLDSNPQLPTPSTPPTNRLIPSELSPPDSQGGVSLSSTMPSVAPSASGANANGKRPLDSLDNPASATSSLPLDGSFDAINAGIASANEAANPVNTSANSNGSGNQQHKVQTHAATGYSWSRQEDAPGYAWQNRKAQEEANRAWEMGIVAKDRAVGSELFHHSSQEPMH